MQGQTWGVSNGKQSCHQPVCLHHRLPEMEMPGGGLRGARVKVPWVEESQPQAHNSAGGVTSAKAHLASGWQPPAC